MTGSSRNPAILQHFVLALLFVSAQAGAAMHAAQHEFAAPASKVCSTCVAAEHLSAASVGTTAISISVQASDIPNESPGTVAVESPAPTPESRGPPATR